MNGMMDNTWKMVQTPEFWIKFTLSNFSLTMFVVAVLFIIVHKIIVRKKLTDSEVTFRWMSFFALGVTLIYAAVFHILYPAMSAEAIGWKMSPFQYEVGMADLAIGVLGIFAFKASYGFRLATVVAAIFYLWGDAANHIYQMVYFQNFAPGNAGTWLWMDILVPLILLICIIRLRPGKVIVV